MKFSIATLPLLSALALATPTTHPRAVSAPQFTVTGITYGGTGCPQDRAYSTSSSLGDRSGAAAQLFITIGSSDYVAKVGASLDLAESRKNCQINLRLSYPAGYQFAVSSAKYTGTLALSSGVTALQKATYYFSAETEQATTEQSFSGALSQLYTVEDNVAAVWSPCGSSAALNVNSQVRLDNGSGNSAGVISGSVSGQITYGLNLQWRTC